MTVSRTPPTSGQLLGGCHHLPVRVYYEDSDQQGFVFYANYLRYFERGRTEFLRHLGAAPVTIEARLGLVFVVARIDVSYHQPARLDDVLQVRTSVEKKGRVKLLMHQEIYRDQTRLTSAKVTLALIDRQGRPARLPPELDACFDRLRGEGP